MRRSSVKEYTETVTQHYTGASRTEKSRLLDEFTRVTGYHRKSAVRLLSGAKPTRPAKKRGRPPVYGPELMDALAAVWEASDRLCGKRLAPFTFTRSRPYKKNDNAHIEQKNWSVVRRLVGYGRYTSRPSLRQLARVYSLMDQYANFLQPVMKLKHKSRNGARVHKVYDTAQTPYQRLLEYDVLTSEERVAMQRRYELLNPVRLKRGIDRAVERLLETAERRPIR